MANKNNFFNLYLKVNDKEAKTTLNSVGSDLKTLRAYTRNLEEGTEKWHKANEKLSEVEQTYDEMKRRQRALIEETKNATEASEDQSAAMQDFGDNASLAFSSLLSGDLIGFQEGMQGVTGGIKGATKAAWAFIATPLGVALTALSGIAVASAAWFKYNDAALEALKLTKQITGLSDQAADQARIRAEVITETFGGEMKVNLETARNLVEQFGISYNKAFDIIEDQLIRGQKNNDEFYDSLREYPVFFAQAKFSAEEFARVIAAGYDLGIYSDKLPDALKEADISLREQTTTTRDALLNAFGAPFTDSILERVKKGETSTKEALQEISAEAEKNGINIQQNAQLTADLFRGAGEDAGGALKIFEALNVALNDQQKPLSESALLLQKQTEATRELKEVSSALFFTGDKGWGLLVDKAKLFGTQTLVTILRRGVDLINWFIDLNNESRYLSAYLTLMGQTSTMVFQIIGSMVDNAGKSFSGLGDIISGVFTLDADKIKSGLAKTSLATGQFFLDLKTKAVEAGKDINDAFSGKKQIQKVSIESILSPDPTGDERKTTTDPGTNKPPAEALAVEKKRLEEIDALQADYEKRKQDRLADSAVKEAELERDRAVSKAQALGATQALLDQIKAEHQIKIDEARAAEEEKELEALRAFEEKKRALQNELELAKAETDAEKEELKKEQELEKQELEYEKKMEEFRKEMELLQLNEEEKNQVLKDLKEAHENTILGIQKKYTDEKIEDEKRLNEEKKKLWNDSLDAAINLAGAETKIGQALMIAKQMMAAREMGVQLGLFESKMALNVAEATGDTAKGAAKTASSAPFPANIPLIIGFAAQVAGIIGAIKSAAQAKSSIKKSFARGGFTDMFGVGYKDETGHEPAGIVHKNEYVVPEFMRKEPEVPQILNYLETKRKKKLGLYASGGEVDEMPAEATTVPPVFGPGSSRIEALLQDILIATAVTRDILFGPEAEIKRQEQQKELDRIKNASKIKKK